MVLRRGPTARRVVRIASSRLSILPVRLNRLSRVIFSHSLHSPLCRSNYLFQIFDSTPSKELYRSCIWFSASVSTNKETFALCVGFLNSCKQSTIHQYFPLKMQSTLLERKFFSSINRSTRKVRFSVPFLVFAVGFWCRRPNAVSVRI